MSHIETFVFKWLCGCRNEDCVGSIKNEEHSRFESSPVRNHQDAKKNIRAEICEDAVSTGQ